ncbi:MAG: hypothetical protein K6G11_04420 [Lachnospiraceae bacterium]|nr:hypothetical protein [Lachnospiraceae bacterium]
MGNMCKKVVGWVLVLALMLTGTSFGGTKKTAKAEDIFTSYVDVTLGSSQSGTITENGDESQYYKFVLEKSGKVDWTGTFNMYHCNVYLYDASAECLWYDYLYANSVTNVISLSESTYLAAGTYYFCVKRAGYEGTFDFTISTTSTNETFPEVSGGSNNSMTTASTITPGTTTYTAQLALNDTTDFYKFTLASASTATINATFTNMYSVKYSVYDTTGKEIKSENVYQNSVTKNIVISKELVLSAGTYYLVFTKNSSYYGTYTFSVSSSTSNVSGGTTANNTMAAAMPINIDTAYNGQIAVNSTKAFYTFKVDATRYVVLSIIANMNRVHYQILNSLGTEVKTGYDYKDSTTGYVTIQEIIMLESGTYTIAIYDDSYTGNFAFSIETLTTENHTHSYTTKYVASTYFKKGYTKHTCQYCGYSYKDGKVAKKMLSTPSLHGSIKRSGSSRVAKLYWYSINDAKGYQLKYSTTKKFKKSKTKTYKVKKLKKNITITPSGTCYFKIRAFTKKGKKKAWSKWSSTAYTYTYRTYY